MTRPPCYELFFSPLLVSLDPNQVEGISFAYFSSKYGHAGQVREGGGRYFDHPKGATWIYIDEFGGRDPETIIDILLHDMSEDAYLLSGYRISLNFGQNVALDVRALTKLPKGKESTEEYLARIIARGARAILTKLVDRLHNLRTLDGCTVEKKARQIAETRNFHLKLLIPALVACGDPWASYVPLLQLKMEEAMAG